MSSVRNKTGANQRIHVGDMIVEELRASRLSSEPRQFEFWFAYKTGRNAALAAAADEIKSKHGALTGSDIDRLHAKFLSPLRHAGEPDALATRLTDKLRDVAINLEGAIGTARAQRETLGAEAAQLGDADALTLQRILAAIDRLTEATKESQTRFSLLETRMDAATR